MLGMLNRHVRRLSRATAMIAAAVRFRHRHNRVLHLSPEHTEPKGMSGEALLALVDSLDFAPGAAQEMQHSVEELRARRV